MLRQELCAAVTGAQLSTLLKTEHVDSPPTTVHPIILDPNHPSTNLLIQDYDKRLCHPRTERVFAQNHRALWILDG